MKKEFNVYEFLKDFHLTDKASDYFKKELNFDFTSGLNQRKLIDLGRVFSRVISFNYVLDMNEAGFRKDLVDSCAQILKLEVSQFINLFQSTNTVIPVEAYHEKGAWQQFI